jgi:L-iditol 2-dehydrogenase
MKAALFYGKEDIRVETMDVAEMESHGLLIRVLANGICGSDIRYYFNGPSPRYTLPIVLGHELCGEVVRTGPDLKDYAPGDRVTIAPIIPCMRCSACAHGQDNLCERAEVIGVNVAGGMAEYMYIPNQMVLAGGAVKLPATASYREAALSELVGCCLHGLRQVGLEAGDSLLVIGGGPIGMTFIQLARLKGAKVTSSELLPLRRELAVELGAQEAVDPSQNDLVARYANSFDRVIVATASVPATAQALQLVRTGGSLLFFSGYLKGSKLDLELNEIHYRELHIHGSIDCTIQDFQNAVALLPQINMEKLVTACYPLDQTVQAFQSTRDPSAVKILIEP